MEDSIASMEASTASMEVSVEVTSMKVFRGSSNGSYFHGSFRERF